MGGKGLLITFEGKEKAGKGTQVKALVEFLKSRGKSPHLFREPGSTSYAEATRRFLQDPYFIERVNKGYDGLLEPLDTKEDLCAAAEMFGYLKARAQLYATKIKKLVDAGEIVIDDRAGDSTMAYQGYGLYDGNSEIVELIRKMNFYAMQELIPHITFYLDMPTSVMLMRRDSKEFGSDKDRIEQRKIEFFEKVRNGYLTIAEKEPERVKVIDATKSIEQVSVDIRKHMEELLDKAA